MERKAQAITDALADARSLVVIALDARSLAVRENLRRVAEHGSSACVLALHHADRAGYHARAAAHYAFKLAPGLLG